MEKIFKKYFDKHPLMEPTVKGDGDADLVVVIPVYLEQEFLFKTLLSIKETEPVNGLIEIILVVNYSRIDTDDTKQAQHHLATDIKKYIDQNTSDRFIYTLFEVYDITKKHAGVGGARKVGMDYAAFCFAKRERYDAPIVSLDGDCLVESNYFVEIIKCFKRGALAATIYFEHPLQGMLDPDVYEAVAEYELHLRYYLQTMRFIGFPYAFHTVGSCLAVSASHYIKAGGMPKKQGGEDFYFLQKVFPLGKCTEIIETKVIPSPRPSNRVPFGTGPSVQKSLDSGQQYQTYNLQAFIELKQLFIMRGELFENTIERYDDFLYKLSGPVRSYLVNSNFWDDLLPVLNNCASNEVFKRRFFEVFNAFRIVKYLNYTHEHFFLKADVFEMGIGLLELIRENFDDNYYEVEELLLEYRNLELENAFSC